MINSSAPRLKKSDHYVGKGGLRGKRTVTFGVSKRFTPENEESHPGYGGKDVRTYWWSETSEETPTVRWVHQGREERSRDGVSDQKRVTKLGHNNPK